MAASGPSGRKARRLPFGQLLQKDTYLDLVYTMKPSFFGFLNRLSMRLQGYIKLLVALGGFALVALLPLGIGYEAHMALAIFAGVALLWTFEAIPMPVTALLVPVLLTAFGIYGTGDALKFFADPIVYLLLGGMFLAAAVHKTGFDRRILYPVLIRSGGRIDRLLLYMMLVTGFLSMWISNTATAALLIPMALSISASVKDREASERLAKILLIGIGVASTVGGLGTVIGSAPNAITSALLAQYGEWTFLNWMTVGMPTAFILIILSWRAILQVMPPPDVPVDTAELEREYLLMGSMSKPERKTMTIFGFAVAFWVSGASIGGLLGFNSAFMSTAIVSLLAAVMLFATRTITWDDAGKVPWGVFLIIGAGLALGDAIITTGAADWITSLLHNITFGLPPFVVILTICLVMVVISNFLSNTASAAVFIPILITLAHDMDVAVKLVVLPAAMVLTLSFITPIGTPPITLIYSLGKISRAELAKVGIMVAIPAVFICMSMVFLLGWLGLI